MTTILLSARCASARPRPSDATIDATAGASEHGRGDAGHDRHACGCHRSVGLFATQPAVRDVELESCACDLDNHCCDVAWDQQCVDISIQGSGAVCYHEGSCCAPSTARGCVDDAIEACVCEIRSQCWDIGCVTIADTTCVMGCFPGDNDCCTATSDDVGCNQPDAWTCVCPGDPFCCEEFWDAFCVGGAMDCGLCMMPETSSDCCQKSSPGGCLDHALSPGVMNFVCEIDETCCTGIWNATCIQLGLEQCTLDCS